jgi:hypothetical protein
VIIHLPAADELIVALPNEAKHVFVLTRRCYRLATNTPCNGATSGGEVVSRDSFFGPRGFTHEVDWKSNWSIGKQCLLAIEHVDPEQWQRWEMDIISQHSAGTVLIYCPPCVCQIHTAFGLIRAISRINSSLVAMRIRVDDRLPSSCYDRDSGRAFVRGLRDRLRNSDDYPQERFDRPWLDKRLYDMEVDDDSEEIEMPASEQSAEGYLDPGHVWPPLLQVIVLGECDAMTEVLHSPPWKAEARMPRVNHIYHMDRPRRKLLGTFDPRQVSASSHGRPSNGANKISSSERGNKRDSDEDME